MEKPCGEECADEDSVFHNGVAQPERFGILEHPLKASMTYGGSSSSKQW